VVVLVVAVALASGAAAVFLAVVAGIWRCERRTGLARPASGWADAFARKVLVAGASPPNGGAPWQAGGGSHLSPAAHRRAAEGGP